eukprot:SAG31_NODE_5059_length_2767_cov_6.267616_1_plen_57_part_00
MPTSAWNVDEAAKRGFRVFAGDALYPRFPASFCIFPLLQVIKLLIMCTAAVLEDSA